MDPLVKLARDRAMAQRAVLMSADIETQFGQIQGGRPVAAIMLRLRDEAAEAMVALVTVDASAAEAVRELQGVVKRFDDFVRIVTELYHEGVEADHALQDEDLEDLRDYVIDAEEGATVAEQLGLGNEGESQHDA